MKEIGQRLQARAKELGLSDAEVARRLGLAQGRYSNYVNGNREPDLATFARICRELLVTPNDLLGFALDEEEHSSVVRVKLDNLLATFKPDRLELALRLLQAVAAHREC